MFKDPAHVREWMATASNGPAIYPSVMPPRLLNHLEFSGGYPGQAISAPDRIQVDRSRVSYNEFLPDSDFHTVETSANWRVHSGSFSSEDGERSVLDFKYDAAASADMACTRSNQSVAFTSDYSISSGIACSLGPYPQATYSGTTARSSPASAPLDSMYISSCPSSGFLSRPTISPQVLGASQGISSGVSCYDDILPGPMMNNNQVQSHPVFDAYEPLQERALRSSQDHGRSGQAYNTFWPPAGSNSDMDTHSTIAYDVPSRGGRQASTNVNPRDHYLYHVEANIIDNLYYCPFGPTEGCTHRPEKLKCNYDKHLDSHLKPYRCKYNACSSVPFSSTACLLRHEREAHGMHGHGNNPYMCLYPDCDRGRGFPRRYNLEDHMRRVHGYEPAPNNRRRSIAEGNASRPATIRATKRRSTTGAAMGSPLDQTAFRINKAAPSARPSTASRRRSIQ